LCVLFPPNNGNHANLYKDKYQYIALLSGVVKQSMVSVLQEGNHDIIGSESQLWTIAVEAIVSVEASKTPNKRTKQNHISECHKLRAKRVRDEAYLQATFLEDVNRSLTELKYAASNPKQFTINLKIVTYLK
jgi:hypothetical protein